MPIRAKVLQFSPTPLKFAKSGVTPEGTYPVNQVMQGRLTPNVTISSDDFPKDPRNGHGLETKRFLHVDLGDSEVGIGAAVFSKVSQSGVFNQTDCMGYYTESVRVRMWLQDPKVDPSFGMTLMPNWSIRVESPQTSNGDGSISSTIAYNCNASLGAFGEVATGNVGGGATFSSSHSHSAKDFLFLQQSDSQTVFHTLQMSQTDDGTPYKTWEDLVPTGMTNPFTGIRLLRPPPLALSNVPICSQAVWMNDNPAGLVDKLTLCIEVRPIWVIVEGDSVLSVAHAKHDVDHTFWTSVLPIDFSVL